MFFKRKKKNKQKEFEKIYDDNVDQIFRFAYLKVNSKDDAEDMTSRVFTRLWETIQREDFSELQNPRAFLYSVTRNMVIDYYRKHRPRQLEESEGSNPYSVPTKNYRSRHVPLEDIVVEDRQMRADEIAAIRSQMEEVREALSKLSDNYQNIIIWYYLDELTTSEIAELLEKPESSVRVLIHRAVSSLKKSMEDNRKKKKGS